MKEDAPYSGNDIYLEKKDKQVIAVCSNKEISNKIAEILNENFIPSEKSKETAEIYKKLVIECYYLLTAIDSCHICINSVETKILSHSHNKVYQLLQRLIQLHPEILNYDKNLGMALKN